MKVNLTTVMLDENGVPFMEQRGEDKITLTLAHVVKRALLAPNKDDGVTKKEEKYELWLKIVVNKTEVELSAEELTLIKKCIGDTFFQIIVGQAHRLLEGKESGIKKETK